MEGAVSILEIANIMCGMPHEKLLEGVKHCPAGMQQRFWQSVPAHSVPPVVQHSSCFLWVAHTPRREPGHKGKLF